MTGCSDETPFRVYRAWVPTQGGYLHFSRLVTPSPNGRKHPDVGCWVQKGQNAEEDRHYIALHQRRFMQDSPLANLFWGVLKVWVNMLLFGDDGRLDCVCLCWHTVERSWGSETEPVPVGVQDVSDQGPVEINLGQALCGRLFLFEPSTWSQGDSDSPRTIFAQFLHSIKRGESPGREPGQDDPTPGFWNIMQKFSATSFIHMDFVLEQDGSASLLCANGVRSTSLRLPWLVKIRQPSAQSDGQTVPQDRQALCRIIDDQATTLFNFLKDIAHEHVHHSPSADSFLRVHLVSGRAGEIGTEPVSSGQGNRSVVHGVKSIPLPTELQWRQDVLRGLYEVVSNRISVITSHAALKGFLCFTQSFERIYRRLRPQFTSPVDAELLRESLNASREEEEGNAQNRFRNSMLFFQRLAVSCGVLVLLCLYVSADCVDCGQSGWSLTRTFAFAWLDFGRNHPDVGLPICFALIAFLRLLSGNDAVFASESIKNMTRIINSMPKSLSFLPIILLIVPLLALFLFVSAKYLAWMLS